MKRTSKSRTRDWPIQVKVGSVVAKIYRSVTRGRELFTVAYRDTNNQRVKKSFASLETAKSEAQLAATKIQNGQVDVLQLTSESRIRYQHAVELLKPTGYSIDSAADQFAEAFRLLNGSGSLVEAARFFSKHHPVALPRRTVPEVYEEFLRVKTADNASERYLQDIRSRLGRLAKHFTGLVSEVTTADLEQWISSLGSGPVARNSVRGLVITFFSFAKQRNYLPKNQPTEADCLPKSKELPTKVGIFSPTEMKTLLGRASGSKLAYLAIGGFAGLRQAELMRLDWADVKIAQEHIEVRAEKAKSAKRRIVPIERNLRSWLLPIARNAGRVFSGDGSRFLNGITALAREHGMEWPHNALRHSFASYRLAQCKSAEQVALEMGNSSRMVFHHYRELVTPTDAAEWWNISPDSK